MSNEHIRDVVFASAVLSVSLAKVGCRSGKIFFYFECESQDPVEPRDGGDRIWDSEKHSLATVFLARAALSSTVALFCVFVGR